LIKSGSFTVSRSFTIKCGILPYFTSKFDNEHKCSDQQEKSDLTQKKPWVVLPGTKNHGISTTSTGISARKTKEFNQGNVVKPTNPHCDVDQG
jgi:hypothetical protein